MEVTSEMIDDNTCSKNTVTDGLSVGKLNVIFSLSIIETPKEKHSQLLIEKLKTCCTIYDFTTNDPSKLQRKRAKSATLKEISSYLFESPAPGITSEEGVYSACVDTFAVNIFRSLPPPSTVALVAKMHPYEPPDSADEDDTLEPAWPHLEVRPGPPLRSLAGFYC